MSGSFDPYYEWLAIAPKDQPPNHYRLLGVELFETDARLIETASEQRMLLVRTRQIGKQSELSQRILNELTQARLTLLDPEKRGAYDAELRQSFGLAAPKEKKLAVAKALPTQADAVIAEGAPLPKAASVRNMAPAGAVVASVTRIFTNLPPMPAATLPAATPLWQNPLALGGAGVGLIVLTGLVIWIALPSAPPPVVVNPARAPQPAPVDPRPAPAPVRPSPGPQPPVEYPFKEVSPSPAPQPEITVPAPVGPRHPMLTPAVAPPPMPMQVEGPKLPGAPAAAEAAAALKEVRELCSSDLTAAKTPQQKRDLSARLLQIARDEAAGSASQFAVFQLARELAAASLDPGDGRGSLRALAEKFDLSPLALKQESLVVGLEGAGPIGAKRPLAEATLDCIDQLLAVDEYQLAADALKALGETARGLKDKDLTQAVADRRKLGQEMMAKFRAVQPAFEILKKQPDDPAANLLVGRYVALVKGEFERGLPMLAKSGEAALVNLAKLEQPPPQEAKQQIALADAWHAFLPSAGAAEKAMVEERAALWFGVAVEGLAGLEKARVEKRLGELPEPKPRAGGAVGSTAFLDDLPEKEVQPVTGRVAKHGEHGVLRTPILWEGVPVRHSIFQQPPSRRTAVLEYNLGGKYQRLQAIAALLPDPNRAGVKGGSVIFRVVGDGKTLWQSRGFISGGDKQAYDISLSRVSTLRLETQSTGDAPSGFMCWLDPQLATRPVPSSMHRPPLIVSVSPPRDAGPSPSAPSPGPAIPPGPPSVNEEVFLDDLAEQNVAGLSTPLLKRGKLPLNRGLGDATGPYQHTLFMQPRSGGTAAVEYRLDRKYTSFVTKACLSASPTLEAGTLRSTPINFRIIGDGNVLWSKAIGKGNSSTTTTVSVREVSVLRLEVACQDNSEDAWGVWCNPRVSGGPGGTLPPSGGSPLLPQGGGTNGTFLDDLAEQAEGLADELLKHGDLPQNRSIDLGGGIRPKHSLAMRTRMNGTASVEYRLNGQHTNFESGCMLASSPQFPAGTRRATPVRFRVLADGRPIWDFDIDTAGMTFVNSVSVAGVNKLRLEVAASDGDALGVWITPKLTNLRDALPLKAAAGEAFLDDLPEQNLRNIRFTLGKHGRTDAQIIAPNKKVYWKGENPSHALMMHTATASTAQVEYELGGKYSSFTANAVFLVPPTRQGIPGGSKLTFRVLGDGKVLWKSQPLDTGESEPCGINIAGVRTLRLEIECPQQDDYTWAAWLLPRVSEEKEPPS